MLTIIIVAVAVAVAVVVAARATYLVGQGAVEVAGGDLGNLGGWRLAASVAAVLAATRGWRLTATALRWAGRTGPVSVHYDDDGDPIVTSRVGATLAVASAVKEAVHLWTKGRTDAGPWAACGVVVLAPAAKEESYW